MPAALIGGALIGGAASVISGRQTANAADRAANAQQAAADASIAEQRRQFDLVRQDTAGQRALGDAALNRLAALYGYGTLSAGSSGANQTLYTQPDGTVRPGADTPQVGGGSGTPDMSSFFASPGYQFNLAQGQQAIERSAAARGGLNSGNTLAAASQYASGLASQEYNNYVNQLMQQAGLGSAGISTSANAGANSANNIGTAQINAGNARASGINNAAAANTAGIAGVNSAIQGGLSNYLMLQYLNRPAGGVMMANNYTGPQYGGFA